MNSHCKRNVPHVACNVWLSGITDGFTYEKYILLYSIYAEPHEQRAVHCLAMRTNTLPHVTIFGPATCGTLLANEYEHPAPKNPNEYKKSDD